VAYATMDELLPLAKAASVEKIDPISIRNECAVLQAVSEAAQEMLKGFDSTLAEDLKLFHDEEKKLTMNQRNCLIMRKKEKKRSYMHTLI